MIHDEISEGVFSFPVALPSIFFFPIINLLGFKYKLLPFHTFCMEEVWFYYGNHASKVGSFQISVSLSLSFKQRLEYMWQQGL